jgi:hypothetical protein
MPFLERNKLGERENFHFSAKRIMKTPLANFNVQIKDPWKLWGKKKRV